MSDSPARAWWTTGARSGAIPGYVADAAVIPGPLAVNPSLTIAALAERTAHWMVHGSEA